METIVHRTLIAAILLATPLTAAAEEGQGQNVPCVGPMCLLTPIYRFGTMMPDMPGASEQSKPPQSPPSPVQAPQAQTEQPAPAAEGGSDPKASDAKAREVRDGDRDAEKATPRRPQRRLAYKSVQRPRTRAPSQVARRDQNADAREVVTIAADATEMGRLLRLASVVRTPPIQVVSTPAFVDGCRQKPDFVVDTMSNPDRVGPAIPLFTESLVILARKDVPDLASLRDRQVSFGLAGTPSQRVAQRVFRSLRVAVREQPLDLDNALDGLTLGSVDAVAFLAPKGFEGLTHHDPQLHLLGLPDQAATPDGLRVTRIDPASYLRGLWSQPSVSVVTVDTVLSPSQSAHMKPNAQAVYAALDQRSSDLAANGFDLLGGTGGVTTMRSSAKDAVPTTLARNLAGPGC